MPRKRSTGRIADLLPLAVRRPRGAIKVVMDCRADGAEGCAWDDTRDPYLGALVGYAEQVFTWCVLGTALTVRAPGRARALGEKGDVRQCPRGRSRRYRRASHLNRL